MKIKINSDDNLLLEKALNMYNAVMLIMFVIRKNIFACLFSVQNTISLSRHEQVCLMRLRFERYFSHHTSRRWEKYLSKRSLIKHTYYVCFYKSHNQVTIKCFEKNFNINNM